MFVHESNKDKKEDCREEHYEALVALELRKIIEVLEDIRRILLIQQNTVVGGTIHQIK